jgi:hypothetical protein
VLLPAYPFHHGGRKPHDPFVELRPCAWDISQIKEIGGESIETREELRVDTVGEAHGMHLLQF